MIGNLVSIITSNESHVRNQPLETACAQASTQELLEQCNALENFRAQSTNLYERVRALFFLYAIHRFHLPLRSDLKKSGIIPFAGYEHLLSRRFAEAITEFLAAQAEHGPSDSISSALASAYHGLGFQTLSDQVRRSVRSVKGNQWMFRVGHPLDHPLRIRSELLRRPHPEAPFPVLRETTPVRMDLTHSAWSDIFFLGMDYPEGARVLNVSVDLGVHGRDATPRPPVEAFLRAIDEPVLRLTSVDLECTADITELGEVFDFAKDHLGLLKAAVIASGLIPPGMEGSGQSLTDLLGILVGPGNGLEIVSNVNGIPKGSRLAVSTNLLGCLIALCMRATGQARQLAGALDERERRLVAARAILGEWLGGSGGGWQDSGGVWPGIKLIQGVLAQEADPEFNVSRGCLLPTHQILNEVETPSAVRRALQESLILVHGGMAQNVGPILEMVTEKYLLRSAAEWQGRQQSLEVLGEILDALRKSDVKRIGAATTGNFFGPLQQIIPWATNAYTETIIRRAREAFGEAFWGFWMLGGMSGGGMGFMVDPARRQEAQTQLSEIMLRTKQELQHALPFAMDPVIYDFAINERGSWAEFFESGQALMPSGYYAQMVPALLHRDSRQLAPARRAELTMFGEACRVRPELRSMVQILFDRLFPEIKEQKDGAAVLKGLLEENGFDPVQHEQIRSDLKNGRISVAQNRLPANATITDVQPSDVFDLSSARPPELQDLGLNALRAGQVAVVTLAAGVGSRWTQGAGVVKALHPFCRFEGRHRTFLETHLAKSPKIGRLAGAFLPQIVTTSYLTHAPIEAFLHRVNNYGYEGDLILSPGRSIGQRFVPMVRDLRFAWEEMPQQLLDEQAQKVRTSVRTALVQWAREAGEASDYTDNVPLQCLHPVGHWYEVPNLLLNGVLARLLEKRPQLQYLMLHNIDTVGANPDPAMLGRHIQSGACLNFEVITRRLEDRGGGLARVNGKVRLVEGLAMPRDEDEFGLSYYNSMTTWIHLDKFLATLELTRNDLGNQEKIGQAIRTLAIRMPTYVTIKEVKKRWGQGQEDIFPVTQFEKLWGDMSALPEIQSRFMLVPRYRGQQLKDQAQLDGWLRDGSAAQVNALCDWNPR